MGEWGGILLEKLVKCSITVRIFMTDQQSVGVGDMFLLDGKINQVFKMGKETNLDGEVVPFVFFKPCFEGHRTNGVECSIPLANFGLLRQRGLVTKAEAKELLDSMSEKVAQKTPLEVEEAEMLAARNSFADKVGLVRRLWKEKGQKEKGFAYSKGVILNRALEDVCQEVSMVLGIDYEKAIKKVENKLARAEKKKE